MWKFINNIFIQKPVFTTIPKLELGIVLIGNISSITKKRLNKWISKRLKFFKLKIIFQTGNRLNNYFIFKDRVPETLQSNLLSVNLSAEAAQLHCLRLAWVRPHVRVGDCDIMTCDHIVDREDFSIIGRVKPLPYCKQKKPFHQTRYDNPSLNRNIQILTEAGFYSNHLSRTIFVWIVRL